MMQVCYLGTLWRGRLRCYYRYAIDAWSPRQYREIEVFRRGHFFRCSPEIKRLLDQAIREGGYRDYAAAIEVTVANLSFLTWSATSNTSLFAGERLEHGAW